MAERRAASTSPWTLTTPSNATIAVPAPVPGDAHAALQAAGIIGDVTYRFNDAKYSWVAGSPWSWRRALPALTGGGSWTLVCEGLMTIGTVKLDGEVLGQVNNQYRRWAFPIPSGHKKAGRVLSLEFEPTRPFSYPTGRWGGCSRAGAAAQSVRQEYLSWGNRGTEDYAQMNGTFPQGPWLSVYLVHSDESSPLITDVVPQITPQHGTYPSTPLTSSDNAFAVRTTVHLRSTVPGSSGTLMIKGNWSASASVSKAVVMESAGDHNVTLELRATNVKLWWPNTLGAQALYELSVSFTPHTGAGLPHTSAVAAATVNTTRR